MRIWHVGASSSPYRVDGVSRTVWLLSRHQAQLGHDVSLVVDTPPDDAARALASESGIHLIHVKTDFLHYRSEIRRIIDEKSPDIVHMHSVFVIRQAVMGQVLNKLGIPYVITPHGGLAPQVLRRGVLKKTVYAMLRERPRFMGAAALALVTPAEERPVRSFIPDYRKPMRWMSNPVDVEQLDPNRWQGVGAQKRIVFLGRFDVLVKGIDVLIETARLLPDVKFDLYGTEDLKTLDWLNRLKRELPGNVAFHDPIFGQEKAKMLSGASFYFQPSRWEGFPVSVAECMYLGVPSAIADTLDIAQVFYRENLGLVVALDAVRAAGQLRAAMDDPKRLNAWSQRGREFAEKHFHPDAAAQRHIELYQEVIGVGSSESIHVTKLSPASGNGNGNGNGNNHGHKGLMPAQVRQALKSNVSGLIHRTGPLLGMNESARTVVLCYHSINKSAADLSIDPEVFRGQLQSLKEMGYSFVNFRDLVYRLLRWGRPREKVACITFDDGYEDTLTQAAPILSEMQIPGTVFVVTGLMNRDYGITDRFHRLTRYETKYLSPGQIVELDRAGIEIGAHSHSHANLARLSFQQTGDEIELCKKTLENALSKRVLSFAYPFGKKGLHYSDMTVGVVREAGFMGAAAVAFRSVTARTAIRIFQVPRFFITRSDTPENFRRKIEGRFDWLGTIQEGTPTWIRALVSPEDKY